MKKSFKVDENEKLINELSTTISLGLLIAENASLVDQFLLHGIMVDEPFSDKDSSLSMKYARVVSGNAFLGSIKKMDDVLMTLPSDDERNCFPSGEI